MKRWIGRAGTCGAVWSWSTSLSENHSPNSGLGTQQLETAFCDFPLLCDFEMTRIFERCEDGLVVAHGRRDTHQSAGKLARYLRQR